MPDNLKEVLAAGRASLEDGLLGEIHRVGIGSRVAILMCTYNGKVYLPAQLESFTAQTYDNWELWVSDDGSDDGSMLLLENYRAQCGKSRVSILDGPQKGFAANFLSLACKENISAEYFSFADQDDIWDADKLARAVQWLDRIPAGTPALYSTRTRLVDEFNREIGYSPIFSRKPSFQNALMQNIGGGNTMVFNAAARKLLQHAGADVDVVTHDWWMYLIVTGCGGLVTYDLTSSLRYRQHSANLVGMNSDWTARLARIRMLWSGRFTEYNDKHIIALERLRAWLTPSSRAVLDQLASARNLWLLPRLIGLKKAGIYRQTLLGNIGLIAAAVFKKI